MLDRIRANRTTTFVITVIFLLFSIQSTATAALVSTTDLVASQQAREARAKLLASMDRVEVRQALENSGVDPDMARLRVASLSDQEVAQLNEQFDELPAGGGIIGAAVLVFIVLLITDILGYTDVFPFVKK